MKILKRVIVGLLVIVAVPLIAALFLDKSYHVERDVVINRPKAEVFAYIKLLKNQDNYSKWATMDPFMKKAYVGTDGTVGFVSAWDSDEDKVGEGEQEIKAIVEGERLDFELRFFEPFESTQSAYMTTSAVSDTETRVTWGFNGHMQYPTNLLLLFMNMEKIIGGDLQTGLVSLKAVLEKKG